MAAGLSATEFPFDSITWGNEPAGVIIRLRVPGMMMFLRKADQDERREGMVQGHGPFSTTLRTMFLYPSLSTRCSFHAGLIACLA